MRGTLLFCRSSGWPQYIRSLWGRHRHHVTHGSGYAMGCSSQEPALRSLVWRCWVVLLRATMSLVLRRVGCRLQYGISASLAVYSITRPTLLSYRSFSLANWTSRCCKVRPSSLACVSSRPKKSYRVRVKKKQSRTGPRLRLAWRWFVVSRGPACDTSCCYPCPMDSSIQKGYHARLTRQVMCLGQRLLLDRIPSLSRAILRLDIRPFLGHSL